MSIHPRKLARSVARAQLSNAGVTGYNKQRGVDLNGRPIPSVFSRNWKSLVKKSAQGKGRKS